MGGLPLPKLQRCCGCTRKLKIACILIAFWSMLSTSHSIRILFCPACSKIYFQGEGRGDFILEIIIVMWVLFVLDLFMLLSSFLYLLGLFLGKYRFTADLFMGFGFATAVTMCVHGVYNALQMIEVNCFNGSDSIAHFIYFILWMYFILIVNSHRDNM
nr:uncharacterized protein LOC110380134 [Helicoverpa armigera]